MIKKLKKGLLMGIFLFIFAMSFNTMKAYAISPTSGNIIKHAAKGEQLKAIDSITGWWLVAEHGKLGWCNAGPTSHWDSNHTNFPMLLRADKELPIYEDETVYTYSKGEKISVCDAVNGWWKVLTPNGKVGWVSGGPTAYDSNKNLICTASSLKAYSTSTPNDQGAVKRSKVVDITRSCLGIPYVWGGTTRSGFDCSGLVQYAYGQVGISLPRTTYDQINRGTAVSRNNLKPGDLVFFGATNSPHHVGMYIGNDNYIHAPQTGDVVKISPLASRGDFCGARRIIN